MEFSLSVKISPYYSSVLGRLGAAAAEDSSVSGVFSALNRQCTLSPAENNTYPCDLDDPLGTQCHAVTTRLIRQYKNRCILNVNSSCFSNCRFCVRRGQNVEKTPWITEEELSEACSFLAEHGEINEIIIAGGDPFSADDAHLSQVFEAVRTVRPGALFRVYTRSPFFAPERITRETLIMLRKYRPLWLMPLVNHSAELSARWSPDAQKCLLSIVDAGIPVQAETLLLRGVNDSVPVLAELFTLLVHLGIKPGNLYQLPLAKGTDHFRVPLAEGLKLYNQLKREVSDLALPSYVVELPGGGGLMNIPATRFAREGDSWKYTDAQGKSWFYPV